MAERKKRKIPKQILEWRARQKAGAIMSPKTFKEIVSRAKKAGARDPKAVGGHAYWKTAIKKYMEKRRKKKKGGG